ncbi:MAG: TIGR04283 family arsenosugar biosynthesis glycosyltransferase [Fibrella sp.]|nr:TIGR04283 family arsenosugar biosynthesis glycosyltransferase [Armatimonadota bacterium]
MHLSIIIPALNEAAAIGETLAAVFVACPGAEVIVVDGGSSDETQTIARASGATVLQTKRGRGHQQNAGVNAATGDTFLFLHADTLLPPDADTAIEQSLADRQTIGGNFRLRFAPPSLLNHLFATVYNFRSRTARHYYGDSAIFLRRDIWEKLGGFREGMLMEDWELVCRLETHAKETGTRTVCLPQTVTTSARRFEGKRRLRYVLLWAYLHYLHARGVSGDELARKYPDVR